ncbi:DUF2634 domain-containing protein [Pelosinus propionicus]|uniref:DUF2634 domain-containing protein n=1 Tax=Pelosinus propionicus DSM 13327 TaxID=1123291 RepID=A0A1I4QKV8_9FIRM|nr:DUF2634 domain-containing protein [Pelosinus propionicus]SFM40691.1 Protein of unknown function [Pelosinus propionicus DSM 13327]
MGLTPTSTDLSTTITVTTYPTKTYYVNRDTGRVVTTVDELAAMKQAVKKILWTERYHWLIYTWNYGIELNDLVGKDLNYVTSEFKRRVSEALLQDDRVESVTDFVFTQTEADNLTCTFNVNTTYGTVSTTTEVST